MFVWDIHFIALVYVGAALLAVFALWAYYDRRDWRYLHRHRNRRVFYCVKCGRLYTHRRGDRAQACPSCGFKNDRLKF